MENREEEYLELSDSELSTQFPDKGPTIVQALVYKRGEKRRPEFLLNHPPFTAPLRRFLRLLQLLVDYSGRPKYENVVLIMTSLIGKMERSEVLRIKDICSDVEMIKALFNSVNTNIEWNDEFVGAFEKISLEVNEKCTQCLDFWSTHSHTSPMYWHMPACRLPQTDMDDSLLLACQIVLEQSGFHVRPHPIIKPVTYVNKDTNIRYTVYLCQITGEERTFNPEGTHRMFFPLAGALQHLRDPENPEAGPQVRYFQNELYKLDQALMEKRQAQRRCSEDNFICSPSPIDDGFRKRRMSSSSETSDGRSPKSPCTKSPIYRRHLFKTPTPSFSGGVKTISEMPTVGKDPRLKGGAVPNGNLNVKN